MMGLLGAMAGLGKGLSMVAEDNLRNIQRREESASSDERSKRLAEWKMKMEQEYAIDREERATEREEKRSKRLVDDTLAARKKAEDAPVQRDVGGLLSYGRQKFGVDAEMSDEDKQTVRDMPADARKIYEEAGAVKPRDTGRLTPAMDMFNAAQETGNTTLIGTALKGIDDARAADSADARERRARAEVDRRERRDDQRYEYEQQMLRIRDKQADSQARRVEAAIGKAGGKAEDPLKERARIQAEIASLAKQRPPLEPDLKGVLRDKDKNAAIKAHEDAVKRWEDSRGEELLLRLRERQRSLIDGDKSTKASAGKPTGGQSSAPPPPKVGEVVSGHRFKGGDPSKQTNWEKVRQ